MNYTTRRLAIFVLLTAILYMIPASVHAEPFQGYVIELEGYDLPTPLGYSVVKVLEGDPNTGSWKNPDDLFIDANDLIYVVDTDNNRIVKLSPDGSVIGVYGTKEDGLQFQKPKGIYVEADGHMYVSDTGNARIVHLDQEGAFIEQFVSPESQLIDKDFPFVPAKLVLDSRGILYVQSGNDYHGLLMIDGNNDFQGYIAPNKLSFDLGEWIKRIFATKEQRDVMGKKAPPNHRNVAIDAVNGNLYTVIQNTRMDEIKKFNFLGLNLLNSKRYGEYSASNGSYTSANVVDIAVDDQGIISTIDANHRKIYQYDQEGNMLLVFGGTGEQKGFFLDPISIAVDSNGLLYVLDRTRGEIQVFEANRFAQLVHRASSLYDQGKYEEALEPWREALAMNSNYNLAHRGVGKALYKQERWQDAMEQFRLGEDRANYSKAFAEFRHEILRSFFLWIVASFVGMLIAFYYGVLYLRRYAARLETSAEHVSPVGSIVLVLFSPKEGFAKIQEQPMKYTVFIVLIALVVSARIFEIYYTAFHFATLRPEFANLFLEASKVLIPIFTWIVASWAVTTIMDGESKLYHIAQTTGYAMIVYIIGTFAKTLVSLILSHEELAVWDALSTALWVWILVLLFIQLMVMNNYSFGRTLRVAVVSILTMIALWAVCTLFFMLLNHVWKFIKEVFLEIYIRGLRQGG